MKPATYSNLKRILSKYDPPEKAGEEASVEVERMREAAKTILEVYKVTNHDAPTSRFFQYMETEVVGDLDSVMQQIASGVEISREKIRVLAINISNRAFDAFHATIQAENKARLEAKADRAAAA